MIDVLIGFVFGAIVGAGALSMYALYILDKEEGGK